MVELQIESVSAPLAAQPHACELALRLLARAQTMGLLPQPARHELDHELLAAVGRSLRRAGIATAASARLGEAGTHGELEQALERTLEALEASPWPEGEWPEARELLGDGLLARALAISPSSLRRYAGGERPTPDAVARRLHVVTRVLAALAGSYNAYGARRWLERPRSQLDGATPLELLAAAADDDDPQLGRVVSLAEALYGAAVA